MVRPYKAGELFVDAVLREGKARKRATRRAGQSDTNCCPCVPPLPENGSRERRYRPPVNRMTLSVRPSERSVLGDRF